MDFASLPEARVTAGEHFRRGFAYAGKYTVRITRADRTTFFVPPAQFEVMEPPLSNSRLIIGCVSCEIAPKLKG